MSDKLREYKSSTKIQQFDNIENDWQRFDNKTVKSQYSLDFEEMINCLHK